ncbi:MAG: hypothetical protein GY940_01330, partial [bacterium]|nr:hypothetical protein [bacterium]
INSLTQAFERSYYHADPHAANLVVMENNVIGYVDFGIVGKMDQETKDIMITYLEAYLQGNINQAYFTLLDLIKPPTNIDLTGYEKEMKELMNTWLEDSKDPLSTLEERSALRRMFKEGKIMRKYNLAFPEVTSRFYRLLMISDMIILQLASNMDVVEVSSKYLRKLMIRIWERKITSQHLGKFLVESIYLATTLPTRLNHLLTQSERFLKRSDKAISNLVKIPSIVLRFMGKAGIAASLTGFALCFIWGVTRLELPVIGKTIDILRTSLVLLPVSAISIWLSRYLISKR